MLATVFSMQSFGQCTAAIVAYAALRGGHLSLDASWRLIYGVAAIPAAFACYFRFTIPETPRYLFDVVREYNNASHAVQAMVPAHAAPEPGPKPRPVPVGALEVEEPPPPYPSPYDFREYLSNRDGRFSGNWTRLVGTAVTWFLLDFAFFGLGLNSPQIVTGLYKGCQNETVPMPFANVTWNSEPGIAGNPMPVAALFEDNEYAFWLIVSVAAILGSVSLIWAIDHISRKVLQLGGFLLLGVLFFVLGGVLFNEIMYNSDGAWYAVLILFAFCQFLFNFGELLSRAL